MREKWCFELNVSTRLRNMLAFYHLPFNTKNKLPVFWNNVIFVFCVINQHIAQI